MKPLSLVLVPMLVFLLGVPILAITMAAVMVTAAVAEQIRIDPCSAYPEQTNIDVTGGETMLVDGDTWHLPDGQIGTADRLGPLAAEASFHGLQRLPSRSELVASFASPPNTDELTAQVEAALDELPEPGDTDAVISRMAELLRRNLPAGEDPSETVGVDVADAVQFSVLARDGQAREVALLSGTHEDAREHLAENTKPIIAKLTRAVDGKHGRALLAQQREARRRLVDRPEIEALAGEGVEQ